MSGKIAFIGTHGVGKTVLTFELASALRKRSVDAEVAAEHSRACPFPINEDTTLDGQMWIFATQVKVELELCGRSDLVICDRSVIDNYAYMVHAAGRQPSLEPFLHQWLDSYELLVLVPIIDQRIVADRQRTTAPDFQAQIDRQVRGLLGEFGCAHKTVELPRERPLHLEMLIDALETRGVIPQVTLAA